jgi:hypothetical protein
VIKLWVDDIRVPPPGYDVWARTNKAARAILSTGIVVEVSLDHDMGLHEYDPTEEDAELRRGTDAEDDGVKLATWLVGIPEYKIPREITIHSWNPVGAKRMAQIFNDAGYDCIVQPYKLSPYVPKEYSQ